MTAVWFAGGHTVDVESGHMSAACNADIDSEYTEACWTIYIVN